MKASILAHLCLALALTSADALKLPFHRRAVRGASVTSLFGPTTYSLGTANDTESVGNFNNLRYLTNVTINGVVVTVALDTGSTDLWVIPPGGIGQFNDTGLPVDLLYGDGSYGTKGTIGVSPFQWGSYSVEKQAFLNAVESNIGLMQDSGIYGLLGLSFDLSSASPINANIKAVYGEDATWGRSVLRNIFQQHPDQPNFIAIDLSRTDNKEDTSGGSFTIGEYDDAYATVAQKPQLPQWPHGGDRWTVLLEGIYVDNTTINVQSTIPSVPAGNAQAMLDTGDPSSIFPVAIADAIYSKVPGAALYTDATTHVWILPCSTTTIVELVFAGERYPIHPLDLSTISQPITVGGKDYVACVSSFKAADNWGQGGFDISLGDTFLRNVYSVFDFGAPQPDGNTSDPFIRLLSNIDPAKAIAQVATIRGITMAGMPPEMDPATLVNLLSGGSTTSDPTTTTGNGIPAPTGSANIPGVTGVGADSFESAPKTFSAAGVNITVDESMLKKYGIIIIGLLAANFLIGIVLIVFGVLSCIRRGSSRKASARSSSGPPVYVAVKTGGEHGDDGYGGYQKPYSQ